MILIIIIVAMYCYYAYVFIAYFTECYDYPEDFHNDLFPFGYFYRKFKELI
jgi:hypothetical protein